MFTTTQTALLVAAATTLASPALAQTYTMTWNTIDGGGAQTLTGGRFTLSGTAGQPDATVTTQTGSGIGGAFAFDGGFWPGAIVRPCPCIADFDQSGGTPDASDIDAFFVAWLAGQPESDADCSGGTPDASDIDAFFVQWLAGGC